MNCFQRKKMLFCSLLAGLFVMFLLVLMNIDRSSRAPGEVVAYAEEAMIDSPTQSPEEIPIVNSFFASVDTSSPEPATLISPPPLTDPQSLLPSLSPTSQPSPSPSSLPPPSQSPSPSPSLSPSKPPTTSTQAQGPKFSIPVLNYHSVTIDPGNVVVISPAKLKEQMAYLHKHGYTPISLATFISLMEGTEGTAAIEKPVLLTFDDGYVDNFEEAMPILAEYEFPATLFMSPGMVDDWGYLNWDQIKELQGSGWDIQPHGMTHPHLPQLSEEQQADEIVQAREQIEEKLGTNADVFCYPYGEYNQTTLKLLKHHGFRYAFTIGQGLTTNQQSSYLLKRLFINGEEGLQSFIHKLTKSS